MSLLKRLFGRRPASPEAAPVAKSIEYQGYTIRAAPYQSEGQYQTAGIIEKTIAGVRKEHRFIRADRHVALDDAVEFSLAKGRRIVDELGDRMFES